MFNYFYKSCNVSLSLIILILFITTSFTPVKAQPVITKAVKKGLEYSYNFNWAKSDDVFQNLIEKYPDDPRGYHFRASIYLWYFLSNQDKNDFKLFVAYSDTAIEKARTILNKNPDDVNIMYILGSDYSYRAIAFSKSEKFLDAVWASKKSESYLSRTLELDSTYYDAYLGLGLYNFAVGQIPNAFRWALNLAGIHGNKKIGLEYIKKAANEGSISKVEAEYYLSQILSEFSDDYSESAYYLKSLVSRYPNNLLFNYSYAVLNIKMRKLNEAQKILVKVLKRQDTTFKQIVSFSRFLMGDVFFKKNIFDSAKVYYENFLTTSPDNDYKGIAYYRLAVSYEITGDRGIAKKYFGMADKGNMDIEDDIFAKRRGEIYFKQQLTKIEIELIMAKNYIDNGKYKIAVDSLSTLLGKIKTDDLKAEVYLDLSEASYYLGNYDESLNYAITSKLLNINEEKWIKPFACYYAARADEKLGDTTAVKNFIDEAKSFSDYDYQKRLKNLIFALSLNE